MSTPPRSEPLLAPKAVPVAAIADELAELWREAAGGQPAAAGPEDRRGDGGARDGDAPDGDAGDADSASATDSDAALVRACGLTVIGLAANAEQLGALGPAIAAATAVVPSRTLLVGLADDVEGGLRAEVSAFCTLGGPGARQVCQEQVILHARRDRAGDLPSLVTPLLVTDLPVVLIAKDPRLLFSALLDALVPAVDLLLVDTRSADDVKAVSARLHELLGRGNLAIRDLAFERLLAWREAIADAYDEVLAHGGRLTRVEASTIEDDAEGSLLLGWIESRFPVDRRPDVRLDRRPRDHERAVTALHLEAEVRGGAFRASFQQFGRHVIRVSEDDACASSCDLPRPAPDDVDILVRLLADPDLDPVYEGALRAVCDHFGVGDHPPTDRSAKDHPDTDHPDTDRPGARP